MNTTTEPRWIYFRREILQEGFERSATPIYAVVNKKSRHVIGYVRWYLRWKKFCFHPAAGTVYEEDCMRDIAAFVEAESRAAK